MAGVEVTVICGWSRYGFVVVLDDKCGNVVAIMVVVGLLSP